MGGLLDRAAEAPAVWAAGSAVLTQVLNSLFQWRKARLDGSLDARRQNAIENDAAFQRLLEVVHALEANQTRLQRELEDEREMRRRAEDRVRELRDEVHALRTAMLACGVTLPAQAGPAPSQPGAA